jgi:hypothetical protein
MEIKNKELFILIAIFVTILVHMVLSSLNNKQVIEMNPPPICPPPSNYLIPVDKNDESKFQISTIISTKSVYIKKYILPKIKSAIIKATFTTDKNEAQIFFYDSILKCIRLADNPSVILYIDTGSTTLLNYQFMTDLYKRTEIYGQTFCTIIDSFNPSSSTANIKVLNNSLFMNVVADETKTPVTYSFLRSSTPMPFKLDFV